jgi:hypothetical protein
MVKSLLLPFVLVQLLLNFLALNAGTNISAGWDPDGGGATSDISLGWDPNGG